MPVNKERCGAPKKVVSARKPTPTPTGPGVSEHDGRANPGANEHETQRPSWQGPGTVVEDEK